MPESHLPKGSAPWLRHCSQSASQATIVREAVICRSVTVTIKLYVWLWHRREQVLCRPADLGSWCLPNPALALAYLASHKPPSSTTTSSQQRLPVYHSVPVEGAIHFATGLLSMLSLSPSIYFAFCSLISRESVCWNGKQVITHHLWPMRHDALHSLKNILTSGVNN